MVSMRFKGPAIVQISKSLFGLKQDATAISKARDILRKEFENYILSVMNDNYGDELREAALDATRLNAISKQIEEVRKDFKKFGLAINYGNLVKPVDERIFYYQKLKPENYDNNLSNYSKANVKLLKHMLPNVTHIKTEYE
jgi:hypothetical protein